MADWECQWVRVFAECGNFWAGGAAVGISGVAGVCEASTCDAAADVFDAGDFFVCGGDVGRGGELDVEELGRADGNGFIPSGRVGV